MIKFSSLFYRIISGVIFVPFLIFITLFGKFYFLTLVTIIFLLGSLEFYNMLTKKGKLDTYLIWGVVGSFFLCLSAYYQQGKYFSSIFTLFIVIIMLSKLLTQSIEKSTYQISSAIFGLTFVAWLGSHMILLRELPLSLGNVYYHLGGHFVLLAFWLTWTCDTTAYFVGMKFGKHRLAPTISPKKSVEGSIGGICGSVAGAVIAKYFLFTEVAEYISFFHLIILALIAGTAGQLGDLVESMLKRDNEVKDSAKLIPGHGGVLDRFDSLLFTIPIFYYYIKIIIFG